MESAASEPDVEPEADDELHPSHGSPQPSRSPSPPASSTSLRPRLSDRNSIVPPYWLRHERTASSASVPRLTPIQLEDHTDDGSDHYRALWAKHVTIDDYLVVGGSAPALGSYVVWNCTVETLEGGPMKVNKRYSEFEALHAKLVKTFPHATGSIPPLPPKSIVSRFRPRFLERRKEGLSYFFHCILLNPEFAGSPVLKEFLFS